MTRNKGTSARWEQADRPLIIASVARERGITGVHTHVRQLRGYLARAGVAADLVTPHSWAVRGRPWRGLVLTPLFGLRVALERLCGPANVWWYRSSHEYFLRLALRRRLLQEGPCTVYAQCPVSAKAALAARRGPYQRVVLAVHFRISQADEWADKGQIARQSAVYRWIRETERRVVPRVDGLVFVSSWARSAVRQWLPEVDRVPGTVIENFVERTAVPQVVGRAGDLVTVGNLEAVKNHRYLLRVLARAKGKGYVYRLDVFGEGTERARLLALASELGVSDQVRLQGFCADVQERLAGYTAYVHASYSESSSLAIMEAMSAGLPVVSSTAGALGELFEDPDQGRFWPIDDEEEAARILIDLMESPAELRRAGQAARRRFLQCYDAEVVAPRLLSFLR
ncbi:glycosyltransferase family 4 protein [Pedococcus sp. 5OH_020]|uniref:glycosyltransferase family 4 protein n=1 Tax=Pedococcus sp. 5OH_020 TaxID=2989814 RepID=UPI0022E9A85D|nr:glycosyltransferase family 4 protein [Pedococcus sp. 5OH_020]